MSGRRVYNRQDPVDEFFINQVLDQWYQNLPLSYTVGDLVDVAVNWQKKGYLDTDVFNTLNEHVNQDICTTSSQPSVMSGSVEKGASCQPLNQTAQQPVQGGKELTDEMLLNVAFEISKGSDVLKLGVKGLKMKTSEVETSLQNNKDDITMAMHDVLKTWRASYGDFKVAYVDLSEALNVIPKVSPLRISRTNIMH